MSERRAMARVPWRTLSSRPVYRNPWISVREDVAEMPDGRSTIYGVVECPGAVGILPFLGRDTVILVGQYRYVAGDFFWEMPTGAMKPGESETDTAQRELREEAGYEARRLTNLCVFHTGKSILRETANIYLAEDLTAVPQAPDATEFIEIRAFPFRDVIRMVETSEIKDAMTVVAVLHAARRR